MPHAFMASAGDSRHRLPLRRIDKLMIFNKEDTEFSNLEVLEASDQAARCSGFLASWVILAQWQRRH